jgi:hypothetical protein
MSSSHSTGLHACICSVPQHVAASEVRKSSHASREKGIYLMCSGGHMACGLLQLHHEAGQTHGQESDHQIWREYRTKHAGYVVEMWYTGYDS